MEKNRNIISRLVERGELNTVTVVATRSDLGRQSYSGIGPGIGVNPTDVSGIGKVRGPGKKGFRFLSKRPGVPAAHDSDNDAVPLPALDDVVISANLNWWQRFNLWLKKPSTKKAGDVTGFVLDYYARNYMPMPGGSRLPFPSLSRGGPPRPTLQRGFVGPEPAALPLIELPQLLPRTSPSRFSPPASRPENPLIVMPLPILRPTPPPGYEYDPEERPDLIAPARTVPLPDRVASPVPTSVPQEFPAAVPVPAPRPALVPVPFPSPSPFVMPTPYATPRPTAAPAPTPRIGVTPVTVPTRPRDYLLMNAPNLLERIPTSGPPRTPSTARQRTPSLLRNPQLIQVPESFREPDLSRPPVKTVTDECKCEEEKKKPKKKKEPRVICYSGSYRERSKSLVKIKRKVIPCQ